MKKQILVSCFILLVSTITLSACTIKDQVKTQFLNKIEQTVVEEKVETMTDEELLEDLDTNDTSLDADLKALESDLQ